MSEAIFNLFLLKIDLIINIYIYLYYESNNCRNDR